LSSNNILTFFDTLIFSADFFLIIGLATFPEDRLLAYESIEESVATPLLRTFLYPMANLENPQERPKENPLFQTRASQVTNLFPSIEPSLTWRRCRALLDVQSNYYHPIDDGRSTLSANLNPEKSRIFFLTSWEVPARLYKRR
jgi:hypothetical protein